MKHFFDKKLLNDMNIANYASDEYLHINTSGINRYSYSGKNLAVRINRPSGRLDYHLLYMVKGRKQAVINGETYELASGDCVFYMPEDPHEYTFFVTADDPICESLFLHFSGTAAEEVTRAAHLTSSCYIPSRSNEAKKIFVSLITAANTGSSMTACGQLLRLLPFMSPSCSDYQSDGMRRIRSQVEYINTHFAEYIDFDECAERCNLSRSRFAHLFAEVMGMPPYKYQLRLRLELAKEMLLQYTLSIGEIAVSVGFSDPLYFSRIFRKNIGVSPSEYRTQNR